MAAGLRSRTARVLRRLAALALRASQALDVPPQPADDGVPEHWRSLVGRRAPELLRGRGIGATLVAGAAARPALPEPTADGDAGRGIAPRPVASRRAGGSASRPAVELGSRAVPGVRGAGVDPGAVLAGLAVTRRANVVETAADGPVRVVAPHPPVHVDAASPSAARWPDLPAPRRPVRAPEPSALHPPEPPPVRWPDLPAVRFPELSTPRPADRLAAPRPAPSEPPAVRQQPPAVRQPAPPPTSEPFTARWPELPDDRDLWTPALPVDDESRRRRLDAEQAGR